MGVENNNRIEHIQTEQKNPDIVKLRQELDQATLKLDTDLSGAKVQVENVKTSVQTLVDALNKKGTPLSVEEQGDLDILTSLLKETTDIQKIIGEIETEKAKVTEVYEDLLQDTKSKTLDAVQTTVLDKDIEKKTKTKPYKESKEMAERNKKIKELSPKITTLQNDAGKLRTEISNSIVSIATQKIANITLETKLSAKKIEEQNTTDDNNKKQLNQNIITLTQQIAGGKASLDSLEQQKKSLEAKFSSIKSDIETKKTELDGLNKSYNELSLSNQGQHNLTVSESWKTAFVTKDKDLATIEENNRTLTGQITEIRNKVLNNNTKPEEKIALLNQKKTLEGQLQNDIVNKQVQILQMKNKILLDYIETRYTEQKTLLDDAKGEKQAQETIKASKQESIKKYNDLITKITEGVSKNKKTMSHQEYVTQTAEKEKYISLKSQTEDEIKSIDSEIATLSQQEAQYLANTNYVLAQKQLLDTQISHRTAELTMKAKQDELDRMEADYNVNSILERSLITQIAEKTTGLKVIEDNIDAASDDKTLYPLKEQQEIALAEMKTLNELKAKIVLPDSKKTFEEVAALRTTTALSAKVLSEKQKIFDNTKADKDRTIEVPSSELSISEDKPIQKEIPKKIEEDEDTQH